MNLQTKGAVSSESTKKIQFVENFCYFPFKKTIESKNTELIRDIQGIRKAGSKQFSNAADKVAA
jgi:hypothetical protein